MRIQHNISSINVYRTTVLNRGDMSKNLEKLSSGYRINRAGDDAAGLAISEKMRSQITALGQAHNNGEDGVSLIATVEGALNEAHSMLNRMMALAVQSANGTYNTTDRQSLDQEVQHLKEEITRIGDTTTFNDRHLFVNNSSSNVVSAATYRYILNLADGSCEMQGAGGAEGLSADSRSSPMKEGYQLLADKIAKEYFPNAVKQILEKFPALATKVGSDKIGMELQIGNIDGRHSVLAFAGSFVQSGAGAFNMLIKVDSSDFSDATLGSADEEMLESTLAHELMHSVMQYTLPYGMSGVGGELYPKWFVEGSAQLTGGGFPTHWNDQLQQIAAGLSSANDSSRDAEIQNYLKAYGVEDRHYGHGYLACAYMGYLASGSTAVSGSSIASGMDRIYSKLLDGVSLYDAISACTGKTINNLSAVEALFAQPDQDLTEFVRKLSYESKGGAGSVITSSLGVGGTSIIGDSVTQDQAFYVANQVFSPGMELMSTKSISFMVGDNSDSINMISVDLFKMTSDALGLLDVDVLTAENARDAIDVVNMAIDGVSQMRSYYGAVQNRLEHTLSNLETMTENISASESRIRDTDMAVSMMRYVRNQILQQSGQSMLIQANQQPESVLRLLGA